MKVLSHSHSHSHSQSLSLSLSPTFCLGCLSFSLFYTRSLTMGYNQGLAVGLAIGIPSFIVLVGAYILWLRNRKRNRREDLLENDLDVELRDNNLFKEFQEALHRPYAGKPDADAPEPEKNLASLLLLPGHTQLVTPAPLVHHAKSPLAYDFYDTFIPILPDGNTPGNGSSGSIARDRPASITNSPRDRSVKERGSGATFTLLAPPPIADRPSINSSSTSVGDALALARSLDTLAKQLQSPQFFEKLPLRAGTVQTRPRAGPTNLSSDLLHNVVYDRQGINDDYVYEVRALRGAVESESDVETSPKK